MVKKKFTADVRDLYLSELRSGNLKHESARIVGVSYRTVERHMSDDDDFREMVRHASGEAREGIEKVLFKMALEGDLGSIKMWLTAHDRSSYGDKMVIEHDATQAAVEMSQNEALAKVADLQKTLEARRLRLIETGDFLPLVEAESVEIKPREDKADVLDLLHPPAERKTIHIGPEEEFKI